MRTKNRYTATDHAIVSPGEYGGLIIGNLCAENPDLTVHCIMVAGVWELRSVSKPVFGRDELQALAQRAIEGWLKRADRPLSIFEARGILVHELAVVAKVNHHRKPLAKTWHQVEVEVTGPGVGRHLSFCCQELMSVAAAEGTVLVHRRDADKLQLSAFIATEIACDALPKVYGVLTPHTIAQRMMSR